MLRAGVATLTLFRNSTLEAAHSARLRVFLGIDWQEIFDGLPQSCAVDTAVLLLAESMHTILTKIFTDRLKNTGDFFGCR